jgi:Protein of unknown function with HXXEE motif
MGERGAMRRATKVSLGLLLTWAVSDIEELCTMSRSSQQILARLPAWVPVPGPLRRAGISDSQFLAVFGLMAPVMGTATVLGIRSGGRSAIFRGVLLGFGLHGFGHLAMAAAARQYVSGAVTAPTMVIPYWLWARRELARDGIRDADRQTLAIAAAGVPLALGLHSLAYWLQAQSRAPQEHVSGSDSGNFGHPDVADGYR